MTTLADLPGLPESRLPAALLAQLPASTPGPPWDCRVRAVVWVQRAPSPLPSSSPYAGRVRGLAVGAVVDYLDSPVGPYREVFAGPLLRGTVLPVVHVPFIAVDSLPSVHGGRAHWALPKALAAFSEDGRCATGDGWSVDVQATERGPRLPVRGPLVNAQAGQRAVVSLRGRGRLARVRVAAEGSTLRGWLGTGTHPGLVAEGRMLVQAPR
jgi:hypothetical protein